MDTEPTDEVIELASLLKEKGLTLALAESCTGGLLGHKITSLQGCSAYFNGGIISYANSAKRDLLGVTQELLDEFGAVSAECAEVMAKGARKNIRGKDNKESDIGLSITGTAGPDGGTDDKPVGTVFISISIRSKETKTNDFIFKGERNQIRELSASKAIELLIKELKSEPS